MSKILFRNVKVVDTQSRTNGKRADIFIAEGKIQTIAKGGTLEAERGTVVHEGGSLSPGWVDMRAYLTDPGFEWKESLQSLANAAAAGGFTSVLCIPETFPAMDHRDSISSLRTRAEKLPVHMLACGALTQGGNGKDLAELFDMKMAGAVAFSDGLHPVKDAGTLLRALQYVSAFGGLIINLPYDESLDQGGQMAESEASTRLGMKGIPAVAESLMLTRDLSVLSWFEGPLHIGPITTRHGLRQFRNGKSKFPKLSGETAAHYLLLEDTACESFEPQYKVFPPLRSSDDVRAMRKAVMEGVIDVISSSHHPQSVEEKNLEFAAASFGASALETCFAAAWTAMNEEGMEIDALIEKFTINPRRILGLPPVFIAEGAKAELTWFDEKEEWTVTLNDIQSKSKSNPFIGRTLKGRVKGIVKG
jgi:dihydroorotase